MCPASRKRAVWNGTRFLEVVSIVYCSVLKNCTSATWPRFRLSWLSPAARLTAIPGSPLAFVVDNHSSICIRETTYCATKMRYPQHQTYLLVEKRQRMPFQSLLYYSFQAKCFVKQVRYTELAPSYLLGDVDGGQTWRNDVLPLAL